VSAEFRYADGTRRGEPGENIASDFADNDIRKVWYRRGHLGSSLAAVGKDGEAISHSAYDAWGKPLTVTNLDINYAGIDNINDYTCYAWDETLQLYSNQQIQDIRDTKNNIINLYEVLSEKNTINICANCVFNMRNWNWLYTCNQFKFQHTLARFLQWLFEQ
jgi:hypothetical protein